MLDDVTPELKDYYDRLDAGVLPEMIEQANIHTPSNSHTQLTSTKIISRLSVEGIHRWKKCPIEEVSYLREYHRHIFYINCYAYVNHSDRDIEFIELSHKVKQYLHSKYFSNEYQCLFFDDMSCEMIASDILYQFNLYEVEVNEDLEGGAIVRRMVTVV